MREFKQDVVTCLLVMLMLSLLALTACSLYKTTVMPEARTIKLKTGEVAPYDGWLLTDGATAKLLEQAERCQDK